MNRNRAVLSALIAAALGVAVPVSAQAPDSAPGRAAAGRTDFPGIEKLMSAEEFERAGLDQLSAEQRRALNDWLVRYTAGDAYVVQATSQDVQAAVPEFRLEARIMQPFTGWSGQTVFRLDNGQVWKQRIKGRYRHEGSDTRVVITRNLFGFFSMKVVDTGRSIGVEPVRQREDARRAD